MVNGWKVDQLLEECMNGKYIVCYGSSPFDVNVLKKSELVKYIKCFTDDDPNRWNQTVKPDGKTFTVAPPHYLNSLDSNAILLVLSRDSYLNTEKRLLELGIDLPVYTWARKRLTQEELIDKRITKACLGAEAAVERIKKCMEKHNRAYYTQRAKYFSQHDVVCIPYVSFFLSNNCSLNCEACCHLIPHFTVPWEINPDDAIMYIDNFLRGVDEVFRFVLYGGEPLLYNDIDRIVNHLKQHSKVKLVEIVTNCTIIPDQKMLDSFKSPKVALSLSDYGDIVRIAKLVELLEREGINFYVRSDVQWADWGNTEYRGKNIETLRYEYNKCGSSTFCKNLHGDKFFNCERAARMYMLGNVYNAEYDYATLNFNDTDDTIKEKIKEMQLRDYMDGCNYCDAAVDNVKIIPAGKQIGKDLNRSEYTLVKRDQIDRYIAGQI